MNIPRSLLAAALLGTAGVVATTAPVARAQTTATAVTDPVGFLSIPLPANSDTFVSIPFTRPAEYTGPVTSVSGSGATGTLTVGGTPNWTANQYVYGSNTSNDAHKTYYALIGPRSVVLPGTVSVSNAGTTVTATTAFPADLAVGDGFSVNGRTFTIAALPSTTTLTLDRAYPDATAGGLSATYNHSPSEGRFYTVTASGTNTLTVNLNGDSLSNVTATTQVSVLPYWTLGTAFPASDAGKSFTASTSTRTRSTQILTPDFTTAGVNVAPKNAYYFFSGNWRQAGIDPAASFDDATLLPDSYFVVRNTNSPATTFTPAGNVAVNRLATPLEAQAGGPQDNPVTQARPAGVKLSDLGLVSSGAFVVSTSTRTRADQLLIYDNNQIGVNKAASVSYYYFNNAWRKAGQDPALDFGADVIAPGAGMLVRKAASSTPTLFWQNARSFLN